MSKQHGRLLVIQDSHRNHNALVRHLEGEGHRVSIAWDGGTALDMMRTQPFDLLFLSVDTTVLNGFEILEQMKGDPELDQLPVIVMSASADMDDVIRSIQLGADDYIHEPINIPLLDARVTVCLEKRRLQEAQIEHIRKVEKLADHMERVILPMGIALSAETDFERMLERILLESKAICNADAGTVYMRTENDTLRFAIVRTDSLGISLGGTSGNPVSFPHVPLYVRDTGEPNEHNVASYVALHGKSINIPDIYEAEGFDFSATKVFDRQNNYRSVSSLTVPLKDNKGFVIGVLQLLNARDEEGSIIAFDEYNRLVVESLSSQAAIILNNHLLIQHQQKMAKIENDIEIARRIQSGFLPNKLPEAEGWEIDAHFQPAREVAGDFYDTFAMMNNTKIGFVIADVCDKGVGAALFMSLTRSLIRAFALHSDIADGVHHEHGHDLRQTTEVRRVDDIAALQTAVVNTNNYITENHLDLNMFATTFFGILDPSDGSLVYINGGHCPPAIISPKGEVKARLEATGPAVGMFPGMDFGVQEARLEPGDMLLLFTDGVTDARNPEGKLFTEAGLWSLIKPMPGSAHQLLDRIKSTLSNYIDDAVQFDDITMLALSRLAPKRSRRR